MFAPIPQLINIRGFGKTVEHIKDDYPHLGVCTFVNEDMSGFEFLPQDFDDSNTLWFHHKSICKYNSFNILVFRAKYIEDLLAFKIQSDFEVLITDETSPYAQKCSIIEMLKQPDFIEDDYETIWNLRRYVFLIHDRIS